MEKIRVMFAGLPGKVSSQIAEAVHRSKDMELVPYGLTGAEISERNISILGEMIELMDLSEEKKLLHYFEVDGLPDVVIDATVPDAINGNVDFYTRNCLPFVMLTTGGDLAYIKNKVAQAQNLGGRYNAVVSANMAEDIVIVQAMFEYVAETFPGAFKRFKVDIEESHQKGKLDTSGTAKAIVKSLQKLGTDASVENIKQHRTPEENSAFGVPEEHYKGHGWHTYSLMREDGNVFLQFKHNINGRQPYIDGTLHAVRFLRKVKDQFAGVGTVYSMIDVLKSNFIQI